MSTTLVINVIRTDGGTQPRECIDRGVVEQYAEYMRRGEVFPTVVVFFDGTNYWLADGFHRLEARKLAGEATIAVDIRQGTQRDAILHSIGANADHGLHRTNEDKRRAVRRLLDDPAWSQWNNYEVARHAKVSEQLVRTMRHEKGCQNGSECDPIAFAAKKSAETRKQKRGGKVFSVHVPIPSSTKGQSMTGDKDKPKNPNTQPSANSSSSGRLFNNGSMQSLPVTTKTESSDQPRSGKQDLSDDPDITSTVKVVLQLASGNFLAMERHLNAVKSTCEQLVRGPAGVLLSQRLGELFVNLSEAKRIVLACKPNGPCPTCKGNNGQCLTCQGRGWLPAG